MNDIPPAYEPYSARGTGRTTKQMLDAPQGAVFVWCNSDTYYPKALARKLGRIDLRVQPLSWLTHKNVVGRRFTGFVLDHAIPKRLDKDAVDAMQYVLTHRA